MAEIVQSQHDNVQTMSSREIAELTGKQHKHVRRDILEMLKTLELDGSRFGRIYKDASNRDQQEYLLNKELTLTLVTGYDVARRYALVKRWQELEEQAAPSAIDYSNPAHAMRFLEAQTQQVLVLTHENAVKDEVLEAITNTDETYSVTDAAKQIGIKPKELHAYMRDRKNGWLFQRRYSGGMEKGPWRAFQPKLDGGHLKTISIIDRAGKSRDQVRVTKKGVLLLAQQLAKLTVMSNLEKQES